MISLNTKRDFSLGVSLSAVVKKIRLECNITTYIYLDVTHPIDTAFPLAKAVTSILVSIYVTSEWENRASCGVCRTSSEISQAARLSTALHTAVLTDKQSCKRRREGALTTTVHDRHSVGQIVSQYVYEMQCFVLYPVRHSTSSLCL